MSKDKKKRRKLNGRMTKAKSIKNRPERH